LVVRSFALRSSLPFCVCTCLLVVLIIIPDSSAFTPCFHLPTYPLCDVFCCWNGRLRFASEHALFVLRSLNCLTSSCLVLRFVRHLPGAAATGPFGVADVWTLVLYLRCSGVLLGYLRCLPLVTTDVRFASSACRHTAPPPACLFYTTATGRITRIPACIWLLMVFYLAAGCNLRRALFHRDMDGACRRLPHWCAFASVPAAPVVPAAPRHYWFCCRRRVWTTYAMRQHRWDHFTCTSRLLPATAHQRITLRAPHLARCTWLLRTPPAPHRLLRTCVGLYHCAHTHCGDCFVPLARTVLPALDHLYAW